MCCTRWWVVLFVAALVTAVCTVRPVQAQPRMSVEVSFRTDFRDLDSYGEWYKFPQVGWVWSPYAAEEWRPFTYGHWSWTSDGWMWVSYEPFGWIVNHYGNWYYDDSYGWLWIPGHVWSPARVVWHVTDWEIGWAPMPPAGRVVPKVYTSAGGRYWFVAPARQFNVTNVHQHRVVNPRPRPGPARVVHSNAPDIRFVRRVTGRPVGVTKVQKKPYVAQGASHKLIRPTVAGPAHKPAPVPVGVKYKRPGPHGPRGVAAEEGPAVAPARQPAVKPVPQAQQKAAPAGKPGQQGQQKAVPAGKPGQKAAPASKTDAMMRETQSKQSAQQIQELDEQQEAAEQKEDEKARKLMRQ